MRCTSLPHKNTLTQNGRMRLALGSRGYQAPKHSKKYGRKNPVYGRSGTAPAKNAPWLTHLDEIAGKFFDSTRRRSISDSAVRADARSVSGLVPSKARIPR
jgi:hypothetical protein